MERGEERGSADKRSYKHWHYATIDSTNEAALRLIQEQEVDRAIISADQQSRGRGQYGRHFYSPPRGLYLSYIWGPRYQVVEDLLPVLKVALGTCRALEALYLAHEGRPGPALAIEPLNDILAQGQKIAGILLESFRSHLIVGIGLNLYPQTFPADLRARAGYLLQRDAPIDMRFITQLLEQLEALLFSPLSQRDLNEFFSRQRAAEGSP